MQQVPKRSSLTAPATDKIYDTRMPSSTRCYSQQTIRQGNRQMVVHHGPSPARRSWLVQTGIGAIAMLVLLLLGSFVVNAWQNWQVDQKYGYPRTYQVDAVVGHNDSETNQTHFVFINLHGHIEIIEFPGGDMAHAHFYTGPTLLGDNADKAPVTADFDDETGKGTRDMVVHVENQRIVYFNDGTQFKQ